MKTFNTYSITVYLSAMVWLANGLFCKILNLVPRHEEIVGRILHQDYARPLTVMIGISEVIMAFWILRPVDRKFNVLVQIVVICTMNIIEFMLVPDLLLWGRVNIVFALLFVTLIYSNEFILKRKHLQAL